MRKIVLIFALFLAGRLSATAAGTDSLQYKKVMAIANGIREQYAPDKRTAVFITRFAEDSLLLYVETTIPAAVPALRTALQNEKENITVVQELLPNASVIYHYGLATLSASNNRIQPFNAAEMVTQMLMGTPVEILKQEKGYYLVRTPDHYISWVDRYAVALTSKEEFTKWQAAPKVVYTNDYGNAYAAPSTSAPRVSDLVKGNMMELLGKKKRFYQVRYPDGREAYVPVREAMPYAKWVPARDADAGKILETAQTFVGVPYLWGGASGKGLDCSGFTRTCYFLNGLILPRDASQQALVGKPVDITENDSLSISKCLANLQPGDLLFFTNAKVSQTGPGKITHTALYIGKGTFIQSAGLVRINSLVPGTANYDDFQARTLVSARRMLTEIGSPSITRLTQHPLYHNHNNTHE
jgi:cell wall-associated NlpC family hydrolase